MHDRRWIIEAELELLTPLHIGSGESKPDEDERLKPSEGETESPEVARIVRDHADKPWIPPTSVKGLLRAAARAVLREGDEGFIRLFGQIKDAGQGRMARLTTYGMEMRKAPPDAGLPRFDKQTGIFISAHTAINPESGTVDAHKLFFREMVAPGATFALRMMLASDGADAEERDLALLGRLLGAFQAPAGVGFGRGRQDANGRLRMTDKPTLKLLELNQQGELEERKATSKAFDEGWNNALRPAGPAWMLTLTPDEYSGPFLVADPLHEADGDNAERNVVHALRRSDTTPHLPGESFMGALRARAEWLAALKKLRGEPLLEVSIAGQPPQDIIETLFGRAAKAGVKPTRGWLGLEMLTASAEEKVSLPSVALDRFSSAPLNQALFKTEGFIGTHIRAVLRLDERADAHVRAFVEELLADLEENGLTLGHAEARGFGWFQVSQEVMENGTRAGEEA